MDLIRGFKIQGFLTAAQRVTATKLCLESIFENNTKRHAVRHRYAKSVLFRIPQIPNAEFMKINDFYDRIVDLANLV